MLFSPLTFKEVQEIVSLAVERLKSRLAHRRVTLEMTPEALEHVAREAYDPVYGARPPTG